MSSREVLRAICFPICLYCTVVYVVVNGRMRPRRRAELGRFAGLQDGEELADLTVHGLSATLLRDDELASQLEDRTSMLALWGAQDNLVDRFDARWVRMEPDCLSLAPLHVFLVYKKTFPLTTSHEPRPFYSFQFRLLLDPEALHNALLARAAKRARLSTPPGHPASAPAPSWGPEEPELDAERYMDLDYSREHEVKLHGRVLPGGGGSRRSTSSSSEEGGGSEGEGEGGRRARGHAEVPFSYGDSAAGAAAGEGAAAPQQGQVAGPPEEPFIPDFLVPTHLMASLPRTRLQFQVCAWGARRGAVAQRRGVLSDRA